MAKKSLLLGLFFLLCLALMLAFTMPARQLVDARLLPPDIQLIDLRGSVQNAQARALLAGPLRLDEPRFTGQLTCLLRAHLCYRIESRQGVIHLKYGLLNGQLTVNDSALELPAEDVAASLTQLPVTLEGDINLQVYGMRLAQKLEFVDARILWQQAGGRQGGHRIMLGNLEFDLSGNQEQYRLDLRSQDSADLIDGEAIANPDGRYQLDIRFGALDELDAPTRSLLQLVAQRDSAGGLKVTYQGRLPSELSAVIF